MSQRYEQRQEERLEDGAAPEELQWPGKKTKVGAAMQKAPQDAASAESDPRRPDIARIRAAIGSLTSGGERLPEETSSKYGAQMGVDLSSVTVHQNSQAAADLGASGFTHGDHVALAPGVDMDSAGGAHVLAHELVHVAQNMAAGGGAMDFAARMDVGPSSSPAEAQAEAGAGALLSGQSFSAGGVGALPGISLFEGPPPAAPTATPQEPGPAGTQEQFAPNDPRNPDYDPASDPAVTSQVPPPISTQATATPPPVKEPPAPPAATPAPAPTRPPVAPSTAPAAPARPGLGPVPQPKAGPAPAATANLDELVKAELEKRADPTAKQGYSNATNQIDILRIQAVQYSFQPTGVGNAILSSLWPWEAWKQHGREVSLTNPYDTGSLQAWIEGARATIRILGDVAAWIATIADIVAAVSGLLALISSWTGAGLAIFGTIAAIAAQVGTIAGIIKILLDIIDVVIGVVQMILTIQKIKASKDPAERAKLAALLGREVKEVSGAVVGIGVQVVTIVATAGLAAGVTGAINKTTKGFWKNFGKELGKEFSPILAPKQSIKVIRDAAALPVRTPKQAVRQDVDPKAITQKEIAEGAVTVERIETRRQLVKSNLSRAQRKKRGKLREFRNVTTRTTRTATGPKDLKIPGSDAGPNGVKREIKFSVDPNKLKRGIPPAEIETFAVDTSALIPGQTAAGVQARAKKTGDATAPQTPNAQLPGTEAPIGTSPLTSVAMWPSQLDKLKETRANLPPANDRLMTMYNLAKGQAGTYQTGQFEKVFAGVKNAAGQMRLGALQQQQDATEGATQSEKGAQTAGQGKDKKTQLDGKQGEMETNTQAMGAQRVEKPPPKTGGGLWERAKNWLYNQTIGRIGDALGGLQSWLTKSIGGWVMAKAGLTKEELDMAGIETSMRADHQKDKQTEAEMKAAQDEANKVDPKLAEIMKGANADEQAALQAMMESQELMTAVDEAVKGLDDAIAAGTAYITEVSPIIRHEMETQVGGKPIDAAYVQPVIGGATSLKDAVGGSEEMAAGPAADVIAELTEAQGFWPELDISNGITAVGTSKTAFITSHQALVKGIHAGADATITKVQGLIGSQDYEGVTAAAHALDGVMESFLQQEEALADVYIRNLEAVIDATAALIEGAIVQEEVDAPADEAPVQRRASGEVANQNADPRAIAAQGVQGSGGKLPHLDTIQKSFGRHDVGGVQAHVGGEAEGASRDLGAKAYATGNKVAFGSAPDLHTAAHEAAHVVQQRGGVQLKAIDGGAGDPHEQHADAVADAVVAGKSAEGLLDQKGGTSNEAPAADASKSGAVGAQAFATGNDIALGTDAKQDQHAAHETTHAVQQPGAAPVQRKQADAPQGPASAGSDPDQKPKQKDPAQAAADKAAAKPKKGGGDAPVDEDAKKEQKGKEGKEGDKKEGAPKDASAAPADGAKKDAKAGKEPAGKDPKAAAKEGGDQAAPAVKQKPPADARKPVQPPDVAQPVPVAPVQPIALTTPVSTKQLDDKWVKDTGRTPAAHHAQIQGELDQLTAEITAKQSELSTMADTEATKITQDLQGKVGTFTASIIVPGRARVDAAFGNMSKTLETAETKAKGDIAAAKVQGTTQITAFKTQKATELETKFTTAKAGNEQLIKKNAPAAAAVIKKFASGIKPFVDKAKQDAVNATTTISAEKEFDPAQHNSHAGGLAAGTASLRADAMKGAILNHGKKLGADYEGKLVAIGKDVERGANKFAEDALKPAKAELDIALDTVSASAKKNLDGAEITAKAQLDTQEKASTKAVADAKAGGEQKWVAEKSGAIENADKAGKELTDNATAAGVELTTRVKKKASEDAKNYGALAAEIQLGLKKGGPKKYEDIAPKIADAKTRLASGHAQNVEGLQKLVSTGATELGVTLGKQQETYQAAIKAQEDQAKIVEAAIVKDVAAGATSMTGSLQGLSKGFDEAVTKESAKITTAVTEFNTNANAALADFDKKVTEQLSQIKTKLDQGLQTDLARDKVIAKAAPIADKDIKAKQKQLIKDSGALRKAMDGWGTDENGIYAILRKCSWGEIEFLEATYDNHYDNRGKDNLPPLRYDLQDELDSSELAIATAYLDHDRKTAIKLELADSVGFWNDDEKRIEEVMRSASEEEITHLNSDPASIAVVAKVKSALGGADLDVVNTLLDQNMSREDRTTKANAVRLFDAMDGWGTDEAKVKQLLEQAATPEERQRLRAQFNAYAASKNWPQGTGKEGDDALDLALKDDFGSGEVVVVTELAKTERDEKNVKMAKLIEAADGVGTDEDAMFDALDDEEYAAEWKRVKATGDLAALKELEEKRKRDLDGRLAAMGEKDGIQALIDGESLKSYLTWDEFISGTRKNGTAVTDLDRRRLMGNVQPEEGSDGSSYLEWMVAQRKLQTGQAEPELMLAYACWGVTGTHEEMINKVLGNGGDPKPLSEVKQIAADFKKVWKTNLVDRWEIDNPQGSTPDKDMQFPDPGGLLSAELGGKDWLTTRVLLCGVPETAPQLRYVNKLQINYAKSGILAAPLMWAAEKTGYSDASADLRNSEKKFDAKYAKIAAQLGGNLDATKLAAIGKDANGVVQKDAEGNDVATGDELQLLSEYLAQDTEAYAAALASVVDAIVTVLEIVGGIIVTVVTAGTAAPVLAAIIGNLIVSAGTIAFKYAALGNQYGAGDLAKDVTTAAITAGFAGLGEVKALKTLTENAGKATTGALFRTVNEGVNAGGGRLIGTSIELGPKGIATIQKVVTEGTKNVIISSGQEVANFVADEKTYEMKLGEALWGENSIGARLAKGLPKAFVEGAVKQFIDEQALVSNKDNRGGHKTPFGNMLANALSDAGANVAGFFVYVDNYNDAGTFWDELLKSTGNKAASGFFQGYGMHKMRAKKTGRDFINGEIDAAGLLEMLTFLDPREVRDLGEFVKKYGGDKVHALPEQFKKELGLAAPVAATPAAKPSAPTAPETDHDSPAELKKPDDDAATREKQDQAKREADVAEQQRLAAEAEQQRLQQLADEQKKQQQKPVAEQTTPVEDPVARQKAEDEAKAAQAKKDREVDDAWKQHDPDQALTDKERADRKAADEKAAHQQKRDQEQKLKDEQSDQMRDDAADAAQRDAAKAKRDAEQKRDAADGKLPTLDEVVAADEQNKQKKASEPDASTPVPARPVDKTEEPAPTVKMPPAAEMAAKGNQIYQHYMKDEHFDRFIAWANANPAKPMPELAFSGVSSEALDAIIQTGLKSGRALGKRGANADNIWFKAGAPFYADNVTLVMPSGRLRDIGGKDTVGLAGQKDVMTLSHDTRPDGIPISEFAIVYSIGHGYVIPLHIPEGWSHPIGQIPPADMLPDEYKHLAAGPKKADAPAPAKKTDEPVADATPVAKPDEEAAPVGSHKGKDTFQPRTQGEGDAKQLVKYSAAELVTGLDPLIDKPGAPLAITNVTENGASMTVKVKTPSGETIEVAVQLKITENLTPASSHDGDGGAARFTLDPKDGQWKATIELAQGLDPRDIRFVVGHELDEIADIVAKHPTGNAKKAMADEMVAGVTRDNDRGTKIKSHDIAAAKEVVELFLDWQQLAADGHPDAARRKETLDRALKANNLKELNEAKLALLTEVNAPAALINQLRGEAAEPATTTKKKAPLKVEPGTTPPDLSSDKKKIFEEAAELHARLKSSSFHGPDFADVKWKEFLQSHDIDVDIPIKTTSEGYKDRAVTASDKLLDRDTPQASSIPDAGGTVAKDPSVTPRSPTVKYMSEPVSKAAFKEMAQNPTSFKVLDGAGTDRITIEVTLADGTTKKQLVKLAEPTHVPGEAMAGMRVDGNEIHVWVSNELPDDQAHRAFGAIMGRVVAKVKEGTDGPQDPKKSAAAGQIEGLLGHLSVVQKENQNDPESLPEELPATADPKKTNLAIERAKVADRNSKRESEERIAAEIDLLIANNPDAVKDLPAPLAAKVQAHIEQRKQLGFDPNKIIDPSALPKKPVDEPTDRPSTVLPGAPKQLRPYNETDKRTILELKVVFESIKEIDSRLQERDQTNTSDRKAPTIAAGETMRRKALVEQARVMMEQLQLGGSDPAYYNQRLTELDAVFPGAKAALGDHVTTRVAKRNEADQSHKDAQEYAKRAQAKSKDLENMLAATATAGKPFTCDRIVVGDGPTGLANIAGLTEKGGIKPDGDGFIDPKKMLVVGGPDLIAKMAETGPNMRWGQRPEVFDGDESSHPIFRGDRKGLLQGAAEDQGDFSTVGQVHDAMDNARSKMGVARAQATVLRVELQDGPGVENWAAADHPVRVTMMVNGVKVVVYTKATDITTGIGTARLPDETILSAKDRAKLVDGPNKVMVNGEDAMMEKQFAGEKVLVIGYGPTGAWAAIEAQRRGADSVDWGGTSAQLPRDAKAKSGDRAQSPEDQFGSLKGVDRVQETLNPTAEINVTTDRIAKIEAQGAGAVVTYMRGEPPNITTYQVHYTKVINAGQPVSDVKTSSQPSAPKSGQIVDGLPLAPQVGTDAPVWATPGDQVRVMGPAAGGVTSERTDHNEDMTNRGNKIPRRADSPDPRVMEATGAAVDKANRIDPDAPPTTN
jgi:hypothetical protein